MGQVDLNVSFYNAASNGGKLGRSPYSFPTTSLQDGVFSLSVDLNAADVAAIFSDPNVSIWVEIVDITHDVTYPRQRLAPTPQALRVPIDESTFEFDSTGRLTVKAVPSAAMHGKADANVALDGDLAGTLDAPIVAGLRGRPLSSAAPLTGQTLVFDGSQWVPQTPSSGTSINSSSVVNAGAVTSTLQAGVELKPFDTGAGKTGELRFDALSGSNYVGFKAPDTIAASKIWTLPAADGATGNVLATNGSGVLSWSTPVSSVAGRTGAVTLTTSDVSEGSALYFTDARARAAVSGTAPVTVNGTTGAIGMAQASGSVHGYLSSTDWTAFNAKQAAITAASTVNAGTVTTTLQSGLEVKPHGTGAGQTGEARFDELTANGSNFVGLKAADNLAADVVFTLPAGDGSAGQFLTTNGVGVLSWGSPAGGGDMLSTANLSDLNNVATARTNLGLGSLATASAVASAQITDGTIADADISGSAAIATSKLGGAVTSISGHGLGSLATASAVGSTEITDGAIANADISGTAAIATSKLSGAITSISGHGLGSLATASAVGSTEITDGAIADADISGTAAIATSKLSGAVTSISGHGLGSLATLSAVGSSEITDGAVSSADIADGTIANADISNAAAIATSKLSGAVTSIASHGLGSAATLNVGTAASNVVQLTAAAKLPAVDGSLLTNIVATDATKVAKSGDTMTGTLNLAANGLVAGTNQLVLSGGNVGIGTTIPVAKLEIGGAAGTDGIKYPDGTLQTTAVPPQFFATKAADFSIASTDMQKAFVVTAAAVATLPAISSVSAGAFVTIKRTGDGVVTINRSGSDTIDGGTSVSLKSNMAFVVLLSTGSAWVVTGSSGTVINTIPLVSYSSAYRGSV